ncbi:MAG TPA: hypothetical protein VFM29_10510 [Vicinamibacteria bacterium]|nr:hypothetical protein [Vicinamibacteria bacterium]
MNYDDFRQQVRTLAEERVAQAALIPLPELRQRLAECPADVFDRHVLQLQQEGLVHVMTHVDAASLPADVRRGCVTHPSGILLYWIRWVG